MHNVRRGAAYPVISKKVTEMSNYMKIKSIVKVFKNYGIQWPSKVKEASFVKDLGFDKVFVGGLIYDVEEALHVSLNESEAEQLKSPKDVINYMLQK